MSGHPTRRGGARSEPVLLAVLAAIAIAYVAQALRIGVGEAAAPGSGLYPAIVGSVFALACLARLVVVARRAPRGPAVEPALPPTPPVVYAMIAVLVGFGLAQAVVGFVPALGLMIVAALAVTGYGTWRRRVGIAIGAVIVVTMVFQRWLQVPFPKGMLGEWIG